MDAFYTFFTNKIIPDYDDPARIIYKNTEGHAISQGVGFNINHQFAFQNLQVTRQFNTSWQLYAGIQNLWNYRQSYSPLVGYNDPSHPAGFSSYFDTAYAYAPIHGREFYIGMRWNFRP